MVFDVIIVGGGPGGLACAAITASQGLRTLVIERKNPLGPKVCAGGITWNGLIQKISDNIAEKQFREQYIYTRHQKICVTADIPIIATVNRQSLGQLMAEKARLAGAEIHEGYLVTSILPNRIHYIDKDTRETIQADYRYLVGADGSTSVVRRYIGLPVKKAGIGINYQLEGDYQKMEWHLDAQKFGSGYGWVFPHKDTVSVGAYADAEVMTAKKLHHNLVQWGTKKGFLLSQCRPRAEFINFDYQGHQFENIFLVGDAAGLASGLTGEGIYPAIISGESVAHSILKPDYDAVPLRRLIRNHCRHSRMAALAKKNRFVAAMLAELVAFCLKKKLIDFSAAEMAS